MFSLIHRLTAAIVVSCLTLSPARIEGFANPIKKVSPLRNLTTKQKFRDAAAKDSLIFIDGELYYEIHFST